MLVKDIEPDAQSYKLDDDMFYVKSTANCIVKDRDALRLMIDEPCLEACEYLFDCNILTTTSSANKNDFNVRKGIIGINYDTLSEENKKIYQILLEKKLVEQYGEHENGRGIIEHNFLISIPFDETTTSEEFSRKMMEVVKCFQPQELLYGSFSREEMKIIAEKALERNPFVYVDDNTNGLLYDFLQPKYPDGITYDELIEECNNLIYHFYYDSENDRYWLSEDLYKKAVGSREQKR